MEELLEQLFNIAKGHDRDVKKEFAEVISQLDKPFCGALITNENICMLGSEASLLALLSSFVKRLNEKGIEKEMLEHAFANAFKTNEEIEQENAKMLEEISKLASK